MKSEILIAKIDSIEAQLEVLKASARSKVKLSQQNKGLYSIKGILKGKGNFDEEVIENVKIRFRRNI